jgi:hypothetical protein
MTPVDGDARGDDMQRLNEEQWQSLASSVERVMTRLAARSLGKWRGWPIHWLA